MRYTDWMLVRIVLVGGVLIILIALLIGLALSGKLSSKEQCLTGTFLIPNLEFRGLVEIGEQQLCGKDLHWSGLYAPSIEEWRKGEEKKLPKANAPDNSHSHITPVP